MDKPCNDSTSDVLPGSIRATANVSSPMVASTSVSHPRYSVGNSSMCSGGTIHSKDPTRHSKDLTQSRPSGAVVLLNGRWTVLRAIPTTFATASALTTGSNGRELNARSGEKGGPENAPRSPAAAVAPVCPASAAPVCTAAASAARSSDGFAKACSSSAARSASATGAGVSAVTPRVSPSAVSSNSAWPVACCARWALSWVRITWAAANPVSEWGSSAVNATFVGFIANSPALWRFPEVLVVLDPPRKTDPVAASSAWVVAGLLRLTRLCSSGASCPVNVHRRATPGPKSSVTTEVDGAVPRCGSTTGRACAVHSVKPVRIAASATQCCGQ